MTAYLQDSVNCLNALEESGKSFSDLFSMIGDRKNPNTTITVYPDIILGTTDVLATISPVARSCFYTSMEAKRDFEVYTGRFESFTDWMTQFGTHSLANYFELKEKFNTVIYDFEEIHNQTLAAFHLGEFLYELIDFEPAPKPEPEPEMLLAKTMEEELDEAKEKVQNEHDEKAVKFNNAYEAVYTFLTTLNVVNGEHLDSCKYYASEISSLVFRGSRMIQAKQGAEGIFLILDSLGFTKGAVLYCVDSV